MRSCLIVSSADNVATALEPIEAGRELALGGRHVRTVEAIPAGHKLAMVDIAAGATVVKYGSSIGAASARIPAGAHVHTHNVASGRGTRASVARAPSSVPSTRTDD